MDVRGAGLGTFMVIGATVQIRRLWGNLWVQLFAAGALGWLVGVHLHDALFFGLMIPSRTSDSWSWLSHAMPSTVAMFLCSTAIPSALRWLLSAMLGLCLGILMPRHWYLCAVVGSITAHVAYPIWYVCARSHGFAHGPVVWALFTLPYVVGVALTLLTARWMGRASTARARRGFPIVYMGCSSDCTEDTPSGR